MKGQAHSRRAWAKKKDRSVSYITRNLLTGALASKG